MASLVPAAMRQSGSISVAVENVFPPQEYADPATNKLVGLDIDIIDAMAKVMGLKVNYQVVTFDAMLAGLQAKKFDMGGIGFLATTSRESGLDLVTFDKSPQTFLVPASSTMQSSYAEACGLTFALLPTNTYEDKLKQQSQTCTSQGKKAISIQHYADDTSMFAAVTTGRADATINGELANIYQASKSGGKLKSAPGQLNCTLAGFGISKGQHDLLVALQAAVNELISDGQYAQIMAKWNASDLAVAKSKISPVAGTYSTSDCSDL